MTQRMSRRFPGVQRWSDTDDVLQNTLVRMTRALETVDVTSTRDFFALASTQIRRELIDLARHYFGPEGLGAHHASEGNDPSIRGDEAQDLSHEPRRLAQWREVHELIDSIDESEREVVDLLFYQGLSQIEAASVLDVSVRTVQRRWYAALSDLHARLSMQWPDE